MCEKIFRFLRNYWRWLIAFLVVVVLSFVVGVYFRRHLASDLASSVHQVNVFIDKSKSRLIKP